VSEQAHYIFKVAVGADGKAFAWSAPPAPRLGMNVPVTKKLLKMMNGQTSVFAYGRMVGPQGSLKLSRLAPWQPW